MKSISGAMAAHLLEVTTTLCNCWRLTRKDGVVLGFTDLDADLVIDGLTYASETGFFRSAITNSATVAVGSMEVRGFLDSEMITANDLKNGRYDYAEVEVFAVNYRDLTMGVIRLRYGYFGESVRYPSGLFSIELRGLTQLLQQKVGRTIVPECDADLGDDRCKVVLQPEEVHRNHQYSVGDRVLVPVDGVGVARRLPLLNPSFEDASSSAVFGWSLTDCLAQNLPPYIAKEGRVYILPEDEEGKVEQLVDENAIGDTTTLATFVFNQFQLNADWQARGVVEILDAGGLVAVTKTTTWAATTLNTWVTRTLDCDDEDITPGGFRVRIEWRPDPVELPTGAAQILFDDCSITHNGTAEAGAALQSPGFELTYQADLGIISWGGGFGPVRRLANINFQPYEGEAYLLISTFDATTQVVVFTDADGVEEVDIDAGEFEVQVKGRVGAEEWGYVYEVRLDFLTAADGLISTLTTGEIEVRPERVWRDFTLRGPVPATARKVRVELDGGPGPRNTSTRQKVVYDAVYLDLYDSNYQANRFDAYGGIEFVALTNGYTAGTQPTFDTDLGDETIDGTVVWDAVVPTFTFLGTVVTVTDHTHFTISGAESAVDQWFQFGIIEFLDGENAGRMVEIVSWVQSTGALEILLPMLWEPEVGDLCKVVVGCDKSTDMCFTRFNNILNFRGFPAVPGTDEYFKVGGVST